MADLAALIGSLRSADAPQELSPMAATASALMATAAHPGALLIVHLALLAIARGTDGDPLEEADWSAIRMLLARLAELLESPETAMLDPLGFEWRNWKRPAALQ